MIKNTSGLAVQPCRLHERFYYHARLLYYILRQKARGFFARGCSPLATPICEGAGAPSALPNVGAQLPRPQRAGAPREHGFAMLGAPGDFLMRRKSPKTHQEPPGSWTSGTRGRTPLDSPAPCPSGIGCGSIEPAASSGAILPSHGLKTQSVPSMKPKEKNKTGLSTSSKWQIGLGLWQKVARRETERSAASAKRAAATHRGIPKGAALGAPLVTFPATGKSPGVGGAERPPL